MAQDFEQMLKEIFGEPVSRLTQFSSDQMQKLTSKLNELAREAVSEELTKLRTEISELRSRLTVLENERAQQAAESVESSF